MALLHKLEKFMFNSRSRIDTPNTPKNFIKISRMADKGNQQHKHGSYEPKTAVQWTYDDE